MPTGPKENPADPQRPRVSSPCTPGLAHADRRFTARHSPVSQASLWGRGDPARLEDPAGSRATGRVRVGPGLQEDRAKLEPAHSPRQDITVTGMGTDTPEQGPGTRCQGQEPASARPWSWPPSDRRWPLSRPWSCCPPTGASLCPPVVTPPTNGSQPLSCPWSRRPPTRAGLLCEQAQGPAHQDPHIPEALCLPAHPSDLRSQEDPAGERSGSALAGTEALGGLAPRALQGHSASSRPLTMGPGLPVRPIGPAGPLSANYEGEDTEGCQGGRAGHCFLTTAPTL